MRRQLAADGAKPATPAPSGARRQQPQVAAPARSPGSAVDPGRGPRRRPGPKTAMVALGHLAVLAGRAAVPRRTVRLRLTALYGALFLASGAGLLAITNVLARGWPWLFDVSIRTGPPGKAQDIRLSPSRLNDFQHQAQALVAHQRAAELHQLLAGSAVALGVMAVVSVVLGWVVAGRVLRPLRQMTAATRRISEDNLGERLAVPGPGDELKDLGDTIDGLLARLERAFTAQRRFTANASHELRTPLAMMRTSVDVAIAKPAVPAEVTVLAGKLREGLDQADRLVESLLLLARAQHGAKDDQETVCLGRVLASAIEARGDLIARMGLQVQQATTGAWVAGNATLLSRMTGNIIDNAIRHNQPGGWIHAETSADAAVARLVVENGGAVLDQDKVTGLAQPFRRLRADRTGSATGTGLGLSIVEAIASAHGGTLRPHARPQGGLRVLIELPSATGAMPAGMPAVPAGAGAVR
jgi:signal transduction histidine kinase